MRSFFVRWRSARRFREYEFFAPDRAGAAIMEALASSAGAEIWQQGVTWRCPGCGDRTMRTEEFVEGLQCARSWLETALETASTTHSPDGSSGKSAALRWLDEIEAAIFGCERDRVYIKDADGHCRFEGETYRSRV